MPLPTSHRSTPRVALGILFLFGLIRIGWTADAAGPSSWEPEIQAFAAADRTSPPPANPIVFVGSSSIRLWKTLTEDFKGLPVVNRGFGGSQIEDSTFYADRIVLPYHPKWVILYAGDNDLASGKRPQQLKADFEAFVRKVQAAAPDAQIAFISIKPSPSRWKLAPEIREANRLVAQVIRADARLHYIDVFTPMLGPDGQPRPDLFVKDQLHMNRSGYALWTSLILPVLEGVSDDRLAPSASDQHALLERAVDTRPNPRQVDWQRRELIAFAHFGPNTFSDREWGTGQEDPAIFNPTALDCRQWVRILKDAGMKQVILTAKHHDGFCLWPSRFTEHSVKNSPWRGGDGDVVRELAAACQEAGLRLGLYLSPADLNAMERHVYGKTEVKSRVIPTPVPGWTPKHSFKKEGQWDEYNSYFMNQLFELLTEYGEISEVWFDGANPKPGSGQHYAYADWYSLIRALQPHAVIFGKGPDVRWCGNEAGQGRASEWSVIPLPVAPELFEWPDMTGPDLGSLSKLKDAPFFHWYPSEVDVSIRPGWFYHAKEDDQVKTLAKLRQIYLASVGNNSVLLLNVPPDRRGLIHEQDAARLHDFGEWIRASFADNLAQGAHAIASHTRANDPIFAAAHTVDHNPESYWTTDDWQTSASIEYELKGPKHFNLAMLQEQIRDGQRIESFAVDAWSNGAWQELGTGTTVGYKRLVPFPTVEASRVRVRILNSRIRPTVENFGLFLEDRE